MAFTYQDRCQQVRDLIGPKVMTYSFELEEDYREDLREWARALNDVAGELMDAASNRFIWPEEEVLEL